MTYSKEFKQQAIKLSDEIGTKKACEQLGLTYFTLGDWRKKLYRNAQRLVSQKRLFFYALGTPQNYKGNKRKE
ncbi:MAG: transposase [Spirochaetales bacterium]|nr:transposase [Spirochaetales bacterium]